MVVLSEIANALKQLLTDEGVVALKQVDFVVCNTSDMYIAHMQCQWLANKVVFYRCEINPSLSHLPTMV